MAIVTGLRVFRKQPVQDNAYPIPIIRHRGAETGQGILTNMFEHVDAQRIVRVYEEA
jgi:hypothetical protein